jgi:2-polyprenyl-3-methyl-5-hydroxy-6-metoxy-1,4-benzoquinol methylase
MVDIQTIADGLTLGGDGIWYSSGTTTLSYPFDGNDVYAAVEEASFWFKHRNNCIVAVVNAYPSADRGAIFDIGGGNGFVSAALAASGHDVVVVEPGPRGALNAKRKGLDTVVCASTDTAGFRSHSLPAVGLFDVVEHIRDDVSFLTSIRGMVKHGGRLYITVPAYPFLWSAEDVSAGHCRRYSLTSICEVIKRAGFAIEFASYIFRWLPIPIALLRSLPYRLGIARSEPKTEQVVHDHVVQSGTLAKMLDVAWNAEVKRLTRREPMRFGGSCLVVATGP